MNCINIHGRLTRDVDISYTNSDKPLAIAKFSIAVDRGFKDKNGNRQTDFFNCISFGGQAETIDKYFKKGNGITVQGEMQNNRYEGKDGKMRDKWEIKVDKFDFELSKKIEESPSKTTDEPYYPIDENVKDEDLPF